MPCTNSSCVHRLSQRLIHPSFGLAFFGSGLEEIFWQNSELDDNKTKLRPNSSISSLVQAEQ